MHVLLMAKNFLYRVSIVPHRKSTAKDEDIAKEHVDSVTHCIPIDQFKMLISKLPKGTLQCNCHQPLCHELARLKDRLEC